MKTFKHILWAFLAPVIFAGCADDPNYSTGASENPDNYGVYFPEQITSTEVERDPADDPTVTYKVRRAKYLDAITVPVEITTNVAGILEVSPITFGPGEQETDVKISFPKAEEGVKYTCDIQIKDPRYISLYGNRATGLSFTVVRAGWSLVKSSDGAHTKGKWRDEVLSNMYSINSASFNPYPEIEVEIYQRNDIKGFYRMKVYGDALVKALAGGPISVQSRDLYTTIDARDPDKVFVPYQSTGLTLSTDDGEIRFGSNVPENFMMDASAAQYGTLKDGVISFPAQSIMLELEKKAGAFYYGNRNGMLRILLPGVVVPNYKVTLAKSEPADGVVKIAATMAEDAKSLKFALYEGVLDDGQASLTAQEMDASKKFDGEIKATGTIQIENRKTGKYTLVGCVYDKTGAMRDYAYVSFGYIARGETKPVILTLGLEATNEFAGQGITPDNSAKFYAYGEQIESVTFGLYRTDRMGSASHDALLNASGLKFNKEQLAALNSGHFSTLLTGLNGDRDYTLLLRADNGYIRQIFQATYKTTGHYNPAEDTFAYSDFLPVEQQPSLEYLQTTTWNYYAVNYIVPEGVQPVRKKIGTVTMKKNETQSSSSMPVLDVKGLSGLNFQSGGAVLGMYIPNVSTFEGYHGAVALFTKDDMTTGVYKDQDVVMGFVPQEATSVFFGYGMFMGAVADGYLYCVPSPPAVDQGYTFNFFFTGSASEIFSLMGEMILVDPSKEVGALTGAALERVIALRKQAIKAFKPRNFVELPPFNTGAFAPSAAVETPINHITKLIPASAPSVKRVSAQIAVRPADSTPAATDAAIRNVGVRVIEK